MESLTDTQLEVLRALVRLYEEKRRMIKSREVAQVLGKDEGTVRNIITWLRGMGLVESRTGPAGGYRPTLKAYRIISGTKLGAGLGLGEAVIEAPGGTQRLTIYRLELLNLLSGDNILAIARGSSPLNVEPGSRVRITSKPVERIIIEGRLAQVFRETGEMLVRVEKLIVIPDAPVGEIARRRLITLRDNMTIREAARVLSNHGIRGAPVFDQRGRLAGFITTTDIARLVAEGVNMDEPLGRYMRHHVFSIGENESIIVAMSLMDFHSVGRLLVVDSRGRPVGIVTRTDILRYIASLQRRGRAS